MNILLRQHRLEWPGGFVPIKKDADERHAISCRVALAEDVNLTSNHPEMIVAADVMDEQGEGISETFGNCLFYPDPRLCEKQGILAAPALVNCATGRIPVRMLNTGGATKLYRGKTLGRIQEAPVFTQFHPLLSSPETVSGTHNPPLDDSQFNIPENDLTPDKRTQLRQLLQEYSDIFSQGTTDIGRTKITRHSIATGNTMPIRQQRYRQPFHIRQEIEQQVQAMLQNDIVRPSTSPWNSPVLMVPKKDGTFRFCVDFRRLNSITDKDAYPIPRVDETLESLGGTQFFSTLDLASGYWQVELDDESKPKTAFTTRTGHYEFQVMPFGLCNAPATFQRLMELTLRGLTWETCLIYLDDVIIFSKTFEEHLYRLRQVFERIRQAGMKLKPKKCHFVQQQVEYLGHLVSKQGIATDPAKVDKVLNWPTPRSVKELKSFLGMASYYRRFVANFASLAGPLNRLTREDVSFTWTKLEDRAFQELKRQLCGTPVLAYPNFEQTFYLKTDASDTAVGAILSQTVNGEERPVAYASRQLNRAESNYSATEKETLAVVWAVAHFRPYLYGSQFVVITDHQPLTFLRPIKHPKGRLARWLNELSQYDFTVNYKSGATHTDADALSRQPITSTQNQQPEAEESHGDNIVPCCTTGMVAEYTRSDLAQLQREDPILRTVIRRLESYDHPPPPLGRWRRGALRRYRQLWQQLEISENILCRVCAPGPRKEPVVLTVIPEVVVPIVLRKLHDDPLSGTWGLKKPPTVFESATTGTTTRRTP